MVPGPIVRGLINLIEERMDEIHEDTPSQDEKSNKIYQEQQSPAAEVAYPIMPIGGEAKNKDDRVDFYVDS